MGEAKLRRSKSGKIVYHHTSTLRTNLIWMSGYLLPEGEMQPAIHPVLGRVETNGYKRRAMNDFPPLIRFTVKADVPKTLLRSQIILTNNEGQSEAIDLEEAEINAISLDRIAVGFDVDEIGAIRWTDHRGFATAEGGELNTSAVEAGDDPSDWWVTESPVDLMLVKAALASKSRSKPRMERADWYIKDIKRMVAMCRERTGVFIPPSWMSPEDARALAARWGVQVE